MKKLLFISILSLALTSFTSSTESVEEFGNCSGQAAAVVSSWEDSQGYCFTASQYNYWYNVSLTTCLANQ